MYTDNWRSAIAKGQHYLAGLHVNTWGAADKL